MANSTNTHNQNFISIKLIQQTKSWSEILFKQSAIFILIAIVRSRKIISHSNYQYIEALKVEI